MATEIEKFIDEWGTFDKHYKPDGGDSCHRVGMYFTLLGLMGPTQNGKYPFSTHDHFCKMFSKHHVAPGIFVRHPNADWDASDWDRMSRDQLHPMIMAAGLWKKAQLKAITKGHLKRGFVFTNNTRRNGANKRNHGIMEAGEVRNYNWKIPDPTGPEIWAIFIRAWGAWFLWPLLLIFDLESLFGSIKWRLWPTHNIAMNHCLVTLYSAKRLPTPVSWLSRKIMPVERLILLIEDHFTDFPNDMIFFGPMFRDAWEVVKK